MADSRSEILGRLNSRLETDFPSPETVQPAFVADCNSTLTLFREKLEAVHASVDILDSLEEVGASITAFLTAQGSPLELGLVPAASGLPLPDMPGLHCYDCEDFSTCTSVLTQAPLGIAETGTLVLPSSSERPTLANFLPDNCIILIQVPNILAYQEDALLAVQRSERGMPRALNLVSGPSKTADIEQTLVYGAHGPIQLHVIVIP